MKNCINKKCNQKNPQSANSFYPKSKLCKTCVGNKRIYDKEYRHIMEVRYRDSKSRAKKRKLKWQLTFKQYKKLININICFYCNGKLNYTGTGLDRKDSLKGYMLNNVVTCCKNCNNIKNNIITYKQMLEIKPFLIKWNKENNS